MVKLLENTFRAVNIGLVNELALMCDTLGIDVWEVVDAAKTKPFGFMPFYPGPGLGGHCIPIDPFYLSWKARQYGFEPRFIELAGHVNSAMPHATVRKIADALNVQKKALNGARILVAGIAYKRDINDMRESPSLDVMGLLHQQGAHVCYADPHVPTLPARSWLGGLRPRVAAARPGDARRHRLRRDPDRAQRVRLRRARGIGAAHRGHTQRHQADVSARLQARGAPAHARRHVSAGGRVRSGGVERGHAGRK